MRGAASPARSFCAVVISLGSVKRIWYSSASATRKVTTTPVGAAGGCAGATVPPQAPSIAVSHTATKVTNLCVMCSPHSRWHRCFGCTIRSPFIAHSGARSCNGRERLQRHIALLEQSSGAVQARLHGAFLQTQQRRNVAHPVASIDLQEQRNAVVRWELVQHRPEQHAFLHRQPSGGCNERLGVDIG